MVSRTFTASTLALLTAIAAAATPAAAQSESPGLTGQSPYTLNPPATQKSAPSLKQAAAFPVVYPISTTVAFVRGTADEFKVEMKEFNLKVASKKENSSNLKVASKLALPAAVLFLPLSAMAGFLRAPIIAGDKALTSKPFSKKAFCVEGDIEKLE